MKLIWHICRGEEYDPLREYDPGRGRCNRAGGGGRWEESSTK